MGSGKEKVAKGGKKSWQNLTRLQQIDEAEDEISSDDKTTKNKQRKQNERKKEAAAKNSDIWIRKKWNWEWDRLRDPM